MVVRSFGRAAAAEEEGVFVIESACGWGWLILGGRSRRRWTMRREEEEEWKIPNRVTETRSDLVGLFICVIQRESV